VLPDSTLIPRAREARLKILEMAFGASEGHVPSSLSIVEAVTASYSFFDFDSPASDIFVLSKGHGCLALYAELFLRGTLSQRDLDFLCKRDGILGGHPDSTKVPGVSASTGSLGHGLPFSSGLAYASKHLRGSPSRVFCIIGDGELNEGSNWEALLLASQLGLDNLVVWIDYNGSGDRAVNLSPLAAKVESFGCDVREVNAHNYSEISAAFSATSSGKPSVLVAKSVKGFGVPFMENNPAWHHTVLDRASLERALEELR